MLSARNTMDVVAAYRDVGSYRGAAGICGVDPKTVKRKVLAYEAGELDEGRIRRRPVAKNTDVVRDRVVIDWGTISGTGIKVFCAVLAWSRVRFVRFARDETAATTFGLLAEYFEPTMSLRSWPSAPPSPRSSTPASR